VSVHTFIILFLFHEFIERRRRRLFPCSFSSRPSAERILVILVNPALQARVLQRIECGEPDLGFFGERRLAQAQLSALPGDLLGYRG